MFWKPDPRFASIRRLAALVAVVSLLAMPPVTARAQAAAPYCPAGQPARFVLGIAALHDRLGAVMGQPVECEHLDAASGNTIQHTTTGLAYYVPDINTAIFTNGEAHWAIIANQLQLWRSASPTPPLATPAETAYLDVTRPLIARLDELQTRLGQIRAQAEHGHLDGVDFDEISDIIGDLTRTRDAFSGADASARLMPYDELIAKSFDDTLAAAGRLFRARLSDAPAVQGAFVAEAAGYLTDSERLQQSAREAYSQALPIVVG